jgi:hypothetical protein
MPWFRKYHTCRCGTDWWDEWDCLCNDRCPTCDAEIEPDEHEAIQGAKSAKIRTLNSRFRKSLTGGRVARAIELTRTFNDFTPHVVGTRPYLGVPPARQAETTGRTSPLVRSRV